MKAASEAALQRTSRSGVAGPRAAATQIPTRETSRSAVEIDRLLRGLDEVPGAWSTIHDAELKLFRPRLDEQNATGEPGTVLAVHSHDESDGILVACGSGSGVRSAGATGSSPAASCAS